MKHSRIEKIMKMNQKKNVIQGYFYVRIQGIIENL